MKPSIVYLCTFAVAVSLGVASSALVVHAQDVPALPPDVRVVVVEHPAAAPASPAPLDDMPSTGNVALDVLIGYLLLRMFGATRGTDIVRAAAVGALRGVLDQLRARPREVEVPGLVVRDDQGPPPEA